LDGGLPAGARASKLYENSPEVKTAALPERNVALTIAIMQPYFIPYAGYFRLFTASDLFVLYDCVQFPRRGWVHRNRLLDASGKERWLTLPLEKAARDARIQDLRFVPDAKRTFLERLRPFPLAARDPAAVEPVFESLCAIEGRPVDYIEQVLQCIVTYLGLSWTVVRSSALNVPGSFRGQDRILEIVRRLGATRYVNAPGGRDLYQTAPFAEAGVELSFLPDYTGPNSSILTRILLEDRRELAADIARSAVCSPRPISANNR
jgi:hypothetical protein